MATTPVVTTIGLTSLPKLASGKVRDLYELDDQTLLFVTSDRISAYDVIMRNGVAAKGAVLTLTSAHWFRVLLERIPGLRTHFLSVGVPPAAAARLTPDERALLRGRSMTVRRLKIFPIEAIVRGYLAGSAWKEYQASGTVHGEPAAPGLRQCEAFPEGPIYTPSTKADIGAHDENITRAQAAKLVGEKYAARIEELALAVYRAAAEYAAARGILIADTKFEFGLDEATDEVVLVDEVLTPDSSRFWPADEYEVGRDQDSFDKQFLRNWLTANGLKAKEGVEMPEDVARMTSERYRDAFQRLTGRTLDEALAGLDA